MVSLTLHCVICIWWRCNFERLHKGQYFREWSPLTVHCVICIWWRCNFERLHKGQYFREWSPLTLHCVICIWGRCNFKRLYKGQYFREWSPLTLHCVICFLGSGVEHTSSSTWSKEHYGTINVSKPQTTQCSSLKEMSGGGGGVSQRHSCMVVSQGGSWM